eukprot:jgi/Ulvmu1/7460/UM037_0003.1
MAAADPGSTRSSGFARSSAASRGYEFTSFWEKTAALDGSQLAVISLLGESIAASNLRNFSDETSQQDPAEQSRAAGEDGRTQEEQGDWENRTLQNSHHFYKWYTELTALRRQQIEGEYGEYLAALSQRLQVAEGVTTRVDRSIDALSSLQSNCAAVCSKIAQIRKSCERLMHEKEMLGQYADALSARLGCFDELEALGADFHKLAPNAGHGDVLPLLQRLDDCLAYMSSNPQYMDTMSYTLRLRQLQGKAISLIHGHAQAVLQKATATLQAELSSTARTPPAARTASADVGADAPLAAEDGAGMPAAGGARPQALAALLCVRFRALAEPQLAPMLEELGKRSAQAEYRRLLSSIEASFCAERSALIIPHVRQHISAIQKTDSLHDVARRGVEHVLDVCRAELQLAAGFFRSAHHPSAQADLVEAACNVLADVLRPQYIQLRALDDLVDLVAVLRDAVAADALAHRDSRAARTAEAAVFRIMHDVQERLIFRAAAFLRDEVMRYHPKPADLDYPACLQQAAPPASAAALTNGGSAHAAPAPPNGDTAPPDDTGPLYPPLRNAMDCLSKLYNAVELAAFSGLGQDALGMATHAVQAAAKTVAKQVGPLDAQLFAIRHLLLLREHVSTFQADFRVADRDLDFSHMRGQLQRLLAGEVPLFRGAQTPAVFAMAQGSLRVQEHQVDGKKELEKALKGACEGFIMAVTTAAVEPLLSFLTKVNAMQAMGKGVALSKLAFAAAAKVAAIVAAVNESLQSKYSAAVQKMKLYVRSVKAREGLLKPIASNIIEAHEQVRKLLHEHYTADDAQTVSLKGKGELEALLLRREELGAAV